MTSNPTQPEEAMTMIELAERCEAATGPDINLDLAVSEATKAWKANPTWRQFQPTASLDAAMALVPDGWAWTVDAVGRASCFMPNEPKPWPRVGGLAFSPALALCAAALRARAATPLAEGETK